MRPFPSLLFRESTSIMSVFYKVAGASTSSTTSTLPFPPHILKRLPRPAKPRPIRSKPRAEPYPQTKPKPKPKPKAPKPPPKVKPVVSAAEPQPGWWDRVDHDDDMSADDRYRLNRRALMAIRDQNVSALNSLLEQGADPVQFFDYHCFDYISFGTHPLWVAAMYPDPAIYNILTTHLFQKSEEDEPIDHVKHTLSQVLPVWNTPIPPTLRILTTLAERTNNPAEDVHPAIQQVV
ncbi:hypothetical protein HDV00_007535 [Rhizophlyctis rosea]|nr:hypothetical protein HDV00_007535 [Rhizophlyctis rosea]